MLLPIQASSASHALGIPLLQDTALLRAATLLLAAVCFHVPVLRSSSYASYQQAMRAAYMRLSATPIRVTASPCASEKDRQQSDVSTSSSDPSPSSFPNLAVRATSLHAALLAALLLPASSALLPHGLRLHHFCEAVVVFSLVAAASAAMMMHHNVLYPAVLSIALLSYLDDSKRSTASWIPSLHRSYARFTAAAIIIVGVVWTITCCRHMFIKWVQLLLLQQSVSEPRIRALQDFKADRTRAWMCNSGTPGVDRALQSASCGMPSSQCGDTEDPLCLELLQPDNAPVKRFWV